MVVDISGVATSVSGLWVRPGDGLVSEPVSNQESLVALVQVLVEVATHVLWAVRSWQSHTAVPLAGLRSQQVLVDLVLHHRLDSLSFWHHVGLSIEKFVLRRVVNLTVFDAANSLGGTAESIGSKLTIASHDAGSSTCDYRSGEVLLFLLLKSHKLKTGDK